MICLNVTHGDLKSMIPQNRVVTTEMKEVLAAIDWSGYVAFDIETKPRPAEEVLAMNPEFDPPEIFPDFDESQVALGRMVDPVKIANTIEKARAKHEADKLKHYDDWEEKKAKYEAELIEKAALDPMTSEILTITYGDVHENRVVHHGDEAEMLETFWAAYQSVKRARGRLFGWCIIGFDLDCLCKRSYKHGVRVPLDLVQRDKWVNETVFLDLFKRWSVFKSGGKLKVVCEFLGARMKTEEDGSQFHFWWEDDRERAIDYAISDVDGPIDIAEIMGLC